MASPKRTGSAKRSVARTPGRCSVLVTGASGGIGRAICRAFAAMGWYVGVHYLRRKAEAAKTLRAVRVTGGTGGLYQADVREGDSVRRMIDAFLKKAPKPTTFICNAGIAASSLVLRQREEEWMSVIQTNLTGTFHCLQSMAPPLLSQGGGSIVVVGSHAGYHGSIGQVAYAASKAGLVGLVKTATQEWGPQNVRVNLVLPGWHMTGLSEGAMPEGHDWADHALRRPPAIEEVARTIVHMAQLNDMSGQAWNCDSRDL
ncbi:MAG: SDR family NAD(P)-dependent oxidoreductase [Nitrospira sp.]|nr:SDR family NAD(P)-dependent oxidoreductase [Nitrospira sp.]